MSLYQKYLKEEGSLNSDSVSRLKKEIELKKRGILTEKEKILKKLEEITSRESKIEASEKDLEGKALGEENSQEKRVLEEKRREIEDQRREVEGERWQAEEDLSQKEEEEKLLEIDYQKTLNQEEVFLKESEKEKNLREIKEIQEKLDEIIKIKNNLLAKSSLLDQRKGELKQNIPPLQASIDDIEKDEKAIQERELLAEKPEDKRKIEEERRNIEDKRREVEEEKWKLEEEINKIQDEEEEISLILEREESFKDQIRKLQEKTGQEASFNDPVEYSPRQEKRFSLKLIANPLDSGQTTGQGEYLANGNVNVSAIANENYVFDNWTDEKENEVSRKENYSFSLGQDKKLIANFKKTSSEPKQKLSDSEMVEKYIKQFSSSPELDLIKVKENKDFFDFMLERAKQDKK
jgi:hypothetical protein